MASQPIVITLTTDFGLEDAYVGQLKGALLKGCPTATLVDLTHSIPAWDVATAAIAIRTSYLFFPSGTIHVIVVDPGVGSDRAILVAAGEGHFFIAPDNGCLSLLVADRIVTSMFRVEHPAFFNPAISATFHGRDIMAPVAATLARTGDPGQFGPAIAPESIRMATVAAAVRSADRLCGQVLHVDRFGNLRTSIRIDADQLHPDMFDYLEIGGQRIDRFGRSYHEALPGELLVLADSAGYLEIAANQANAAALIGCRPGEPLTVHLVRREPA
ncbi:MAG: SAM-dependent chlorinase/fluorinase [Desulfobulbus sp.]|jgi:S-adenosylmethionine hydrolase|uniref:SAM hydrolase/SAM-dependent halogenase family protein n=1 Tax=Desulfobulbus sp. TaxID=895 RepID=UPI00284F65FB|nr:SAM-dependent chlorinase/fluorinase [Desulfobulbus sp.]MDR2550844.1 SAM-dependent chlorinase/fluorinase [Desulfobulbus sp.]